ncbi:hypothetical protein [Burkholderia lata]|nr:hypothetical protein [Burkholderia lata]
MMAALRTDDAETLAHAQVVEHPHFADQRHIALRHVDPVTNP